MRYLSRLIPLLLLGSGTLMFADQAVNGVHEYNGLQWQVEDKPRFYSYKKAVDSCEALNGDDEAEQNRSMLWRLPNIKEIEELASVLSSYPAQQPDVAGLSSEFYWSSTDYTDINHSKLVLNFATGNNFWRLDNDKAYRLCVKGDEHHRYSDVATPHAVTESTATYDRFVSSEMNLTWHEPKNPISLVYRDAKAYCEALPYYHGILDDWDDKGASGSGPDTIENRAIVYFDLDISRLSVREQSKLAYIASVIPENSDLTLYCHTDRKQTVEYNIALSERRCETTAAMLMDLGVSKERMTLVPLGESQPLIMTEDERIEPRNRRVEIEFVQKSGLREVNTPWRLPTIEELHSLVFVHEGHTLFDHPGMNSDYRHYWSKTPTVYEKHKYWTMEVINDQGLDYAINEWEKKHVICVH
jgi:outer membrane protein OmpA-like peptidoglycan-associated protein